jgi:hypothetical protein
MSLAQFWQSSVAVHEHGDLGDGRPCSKQAVNVEGQLDMKGKIRKNQS